MKRDTSQLGKVWAQRMTKTERDQTFPDWSRAMPRRSC